MHSHHPNEVWKSVPGYEGIYSISSLGRVRSEERLVKQSNRWKQVVQRYQVERILKPKVTPAGYRSVSLCVAGSIKHVGVHRLIALAFIPNPDEKPVVAHNDGNPSNNTLGNLRWATVAENHSDMIIHGTAPIRERNPRCKVNERIVVEIRSIRNMSQRAIAKMYAISASQVRNIQKGVSWGHPGGVDHSYLIGNSRRLRSNLTLSDIDYIRSEKRRLTQEQLARQFCTSRSNISAIQRGKSWR